MLLGVLRFPLPSSPLPRLVGLESLPIELTLARLARTIAAHAVARGAASCLALPLELGCRLLKCRVRIRAWPGQQRGMRGRMAASAHAVAGCAGQTARGLQGADALFAPALRRRDGLSEPPRVPALPCPPPLENKTGERCPSKAYGSDVLRSPNGCGRGSLEKY